MHMKSNFFSPKRQKCDFEASYKLAKMGLHMYDHSQFWLGGLK